MKQIIICSDGTWNTPDQQDRDHVVPSNVVKMARAVQAPAVFYDAGVGTDGSWWDRLVGAAFGRGISRNIIDCYRFVVEHFEPGDDIFCFGFSRGAYTARSLCGLIRKCGVIPKNDGSAPLDDRIQATYAFYRSEHNPDAHETQAFRESMGAVQTEIAFLGVWDTVGSLGIPGFRKYTAPHHQFNDLMLSRWVRNAYQVLAIDEHRRPFAASIWHVKDGVETPLTQTLQRCEQVWFPGTHSNIGGGYADTGLSDMAFQWMMRKAFACGLTFEGNYIARAIQPDFRGELRESRTWGYKILGRPYYRPIVPGNHVSIHWSARARFLDQTVPHYKITQAPNLARALASGSIPIDPED